MKNILRFLLLLTLCVGAHAQVAPDYIRHPSSMPCLFVGMPGSTSSTQASCGSNAAADGTTKGIATFTASDFDSSSGLISLDYTNGQAADASHKGFLTSTDWSTFNGKQAAGSYITALTSDVTASGPGSAAATIANSAVTNAKLANMAAHTIKSNATGGSAAPADNSLNSVLAGALGNGTSGQVVTGDGAGNFSLANAGALTSTWITALDFDFSAQSNQTLGSDTTFTIGGLVWTKVNSANDATSMAVVNGSGLVIQPKNGLAYSGTSRTAPYLYIPLTSLIAAYDLTYQLRIWVYYSADNLANNNDVSLYALDNFGATNTNALQLITDRFGTNGFSINGSILATVTSTTASNAGHGSGDRVNMSYLPSGIVQGGMAVFAGAISGGNWPAITAMNPIVKSGVGVGGGTTTAVSATINLVLSAFRASTSATALSVTIQKVRVDYRL